MPSLAQAWLNTLIDHRYRGQTLAAPSNWYIGLFTVMPTRSTSGTELTTGGGYTGYARVAYACSLANWSGTQSDGSTSASSGSRDYISNNSIVSFSGSLAAAWPSVVGFGLFAASSGGTVSEFGSITDTSGTPITRSYSVGDAVTFQAGQLRLYMR